MSWLKTRWQAPSTKIVFSVVFFVGMLISLWWLVQTSSFIRSIIESLPQLIPWLFGSLFLFLLTLIVWQFTKPLPGIEDGATGHSSLADPWLNKDNARTRRYWMTLSYSFMILALAAAVVPFSIDLRKDPGESNWFKQHNARTDSPISIFRGCVTGASSPDKTLHCYNEEEQKSKTGKVPRLSWIVQVGGYVTPFPFDPESIESIKRLKQEVTQQNQAVAKKIAVIENTRSELKWLVDILDRHARGDSGYSVEGGLVIPFYLIILSLIGGGVSLTRRIPEYQKQSTLGYIGTTAAPLLTPAQLREYLVFQIIQFISAPFIATVAYYVLAPATTAATVGLAFTAGFASESVLLWVRAVVVKLRPEGTKDEPKGSLTGTISSLTGSATEKETQNGAMVAIIGHGELVVTYASNGQFVVNGIPEGEYALEVKLANNQICTQRVHIQAGRTLPVWVKCP